MLIFLIQFIICRCAAIFNATSYTEDLSRFSRGQPEGCPDQMAWPQVPAPLSCDDPGCRGISWAVPPYRCRQEGGVMHGKEVFGCRCCPRLIDCDDPKCAGSPLDEVCRAELLKSCICVSFNRRHPAPPTRRPLDAAVPALAPAPEVEGTLFNLPLRLRGSLNNSSSEATRSRDCPRDPPVRCLDPQCRGSDDWKTETFSTQRCNKAEGKLVIDGTEIALHDCPCCPEYIECSSTNCNGGENRACTSVPLHGCFCDWPSRGRVLTYFPPPWQPGDPPDVLVNTMDDFFDGPDVDPPLGGLTYNASDYTWMDIYYKGTGYRGL